MATTATKKSRRNVTTKTIAKSVRTTIAKGSKKSMKTIMVVYTNRKLSTDEVRKLKVYAFKSTEDLSVGDLLMSKSYNTGMQVVRVIDTEFTYYNSVTGALTNEYSSTQEWEIKKLELASTSTETVYFTKMNAG